MKNKIIRRIFLISAVIIFLIRERLNAGVTTFDFWAYKGLISNYYTNILLNIICILVFLYFLFLFMDKERKKMRKLGNVLLIFCMCSTFFIPLLFPQTMSYHIQYYDTIDEYKIYSIDRWDVFGNSYTAYYYKNGEYTYRFLSDETINLSKINEN